MIRYFAVVWDIADPHQREAAHLLLAKLRAATGRWTDALVGEGLHVMHDNPSSLYTQCRTLDQQHGVVLGSIFRRSDAESTAVSPLRNFDPSETRRILATDGRYLAEAFWGSYVAIIRNDVSRSAVVFRSPAGALPCLMTTFRGVRVFFSSVADCLATGLFSFSINWGYVARYFTKVMHTGETGLSEVADIRCGECVRIQSGRISHHVYWDPVELARTVLTDDAAEGSERLRVTVQMCVNAWASQHRGVLLRLSGGFDSSVLLACLHQAASSPSVLCVNRYSTGAKEDEREFARMAARHVQRELVELPRDITFPLEGILRSKVTEAPVNYPMLFAQHHSESQLARERGLTALLTGTFGDQVFYATQPDLAVADWIHRYGIRPGLVHPLLNAARLQGRSVWKVLAEAVPKGLRRYKWDPLFAFGSSKTVLNEEAFDALRGPESLAVPWYRRDAYIPPGKQFQVYCVMPPEVDRELLGDSSPVDHITPFLSQPLVELCLQLPTYLLTHGGWDRALARNAFTGAMPAEIIRRRSKGGQSEYSRELYRRNIDFVRDLLLNGGLVQQGLLDRRRVEEGLSGRPSPYLAGRTRVTPFLNIELWLRIWANQTTRAAAA